ncbi:MAG: right-handed parallel beta-helix repeat-containing protein [Bacteroidetes bacterium]|nr:right-handed parallel beta-helix repeat-containing protein [Bacteroidota bacterium]
MRTIKIYKAIFATILFMANGLTAQSNERGFYDAPYVRYEADKGVLTKAKATPMSFSQADLQSEASEQVCVDLTKKKSAVEWKLSQVGDGLVVRFSVPDSTEGELEVYANNKLAGTIKLNAHYSWEYLWKDGNSNNGGVLNTNPKMRFDEVRMKLPSKIAAGGKLKLVNKSGAIHVDFVEVENVPEAIPAAAGDVVFSGEGDELQNFINQNGGKTIYVPTGVYNIYSELYFGVDNTTLKGAGMWYTQLNFKKIKWLRGGLYANAKDISFLDLYLSTDNYARANSYKAINGVFTQKSVIKNVWAEHFECGAWIAQYNKGTVEFADGFLVSNCRFRNNYADGINLCKGTKNTIVEHCSFRNNGDDDMAIWSADKMECQNNTFRYCTSENCWRASGCAIYGGLNNTAHHLLIKDNLEAGLRVNNAFPGAGFNDEGMHVFSDITIIRCGTNNDLWYSAVGAIDINCTDKCGMKVKNVKFSNIDIIDSKDDAIYIMRYGGDKYVNIVFENINIDGTGKEFPFNDAKNTNAETERGVAVFFKYKPKGTVTYCNLVVKNRGGSAKQDFSTTEIGPLEWKKVSNCESAPK